VCNQTIPSIPNGIIHNISYATYDDPTINLTYQCNDGYVNEDRNISNVCKESGDSYTWERTTTNLANVCQSNGKLLYKSTLSTKSM